MVRLKTPYRYPGAKTRLVCKIYPFIKDRLRGCTSYAEPFVGGGSVLLKVAEESKLRLLVNDADNAISSFWLSLCSKRSVANLKSLIRDITPTVEFHAECRTFLDSAITSEAAFAGLYLNRTSFSGILTSGPIGGRGQRSRWGVGCRYNKTELLKRVDSLHDALSSRMLVYSADFESFISKCDSEETFIYLDPPYYEKGDSLYRHKMTVNDHARLSSILRSLVSPWVLSYDDCDEVRSLYSWANLCEVPVRYSISGDSRESWVEKKELVITNAFV